MIIGIDASRAVEGERTGTEAYSLFLIRSLIPLALEGDHRIRLYFNSRPADDLFPKSQHVERVELPFARLWTHVRLARELWRQPPDVFFTPAHVIPYTYLRPSVATIHDLGFYHFPETHPRRQTVYLRWSTSHNGRRAQRIIADSTATKNDLVKFCNIPPANVEVVYPGVDPDLRPVTDAQRLVEVTDRYGITSPYILFIGTLHPRKNLQRLVDSYADSGVQHQLILAGKSGWLVEPIMERLQNLEPRIRERIHLPGYIAPEDKDALISAADVLLFPSLYEGFGFPLLEGNACGTPVLGANASSIPEIANGAALLVDPLNTEDIAEGMRRILSDKALRDRLVENGLSNIRRFRWEATAQKTLAVLEHVAVLPQVS